MDSQLFDTGSPWPAAGPLPVVAQKIGTAKAVSQRIHRGKCRAATSNARSAALRAAWVRHTVRRAIAAVRSASDEGYRAFGWDRGELLAKLQWLHDEIDLPIADRRKALTVTLVRSVLPRCETPGPGALNNNHR